jgi:hypothetical protein
MMSSIGRKIISKVLLLDARMPNGMPINMQNKTAVKIMANVVMLSDQRSTKSIKSKLTKENIANLSPLVLKAKNTNIKSTIGNGMKFRRESKLFSTVSIGAEIFLKSGL